MDGVANIVQVTDRGSINATASPLTQGSDSYSRLSFEGSKGVGEDFGQVLESYRARSEKVDTNVRNSVEAGGPQSAQLKQLADLYSYAVDTQLLVRTSSQLIGGLRQLVSGQ